ncbi:hypothetical protein J4Q44_G00193630 [Coregonus suidteri]|uniref:Rootletin-like coiled-coil domain-containing protein n=1 Tax=Coregonus suidteri TaxID=861788 RepID=A0AAN8LCM7_9TELE
MESALLDGWKEERAELRAEVSRLQNELAESHAEREELESRAQALTDRLSQSLDPSLCVSLRLDSEWRRKMRDGREREARQALLIHKLQNKVLEYRDRCQGMEHQVKTEERELLKRERRIRDEHSDSLESALIRLEEEQQRSVGLAELNALLRGQLSQSGQVNEALREDLCKLTTDWSKAVEEAGLRETEWQKEKERLTSHVDQGQSRLMSVWGDVITLRRHCHTMKTATDRDLWELRAEFSHLSSSLLSHCGPLSLQDLDHDQKEREERERERDEKEREEKERDEKEREREERERERELTELRDLYEAETLHLNNRISALSRTIQDQEEKEERQEEERKMERGRALEKRENREKEWERQRNTERTLESVCQAVLKLSKVLFSQSSSSPTLCLSSDGSGPDRLTTGLTQVLDVLAQAETTTGLTQVLDVLAQAETTLLWRHQEVQDAAASLRRLGEERAALEQRVRQLETDTEERQTQSLHGGQELTHTQDMLLSEREMVGSLRSQLEEEERRSEERRKENERLRREREREVEERKELESERQRRLEADLVESAHLSEREARIRMELHALQGALQREQLDRERAEEEAADVKNALSKARESVLTLSSGQTLLKREVSEHRDALEKMAALNEALAKDKRELNAQAIQLEMEMADLQGQLQGLESKVMTLRRELKTQSNESTELRTRRGSELSSLQQLRHRERDLESEVETLREEKEREITALVEERGMDGKRLEELSVQHSAVCGELSGLQAELCKATEQRRRAERESEELLRESQDVAGTVLSLERERDQLEQDIEELRILTVSQQHQLTQAQQQVSGLEVERSQLQVQVTTLLQTKDVLQGEVQFLRGEMERGMSQTEKEKQEEREERERSQREREVWQADLERLQLQVAEQLKKKEVEGRKRLEEIEELKTRMISLEEDRGYLERDRDEMSQRFKERQKKESEQLKATRREMEKVAELLRKSEEESTELKAMVISLEEELKDIEILKGNLLALEEANTKLRDREMEEEEKREKREAEERERVERLKGELAQKDVEEERGGRVERLGAQVNALEEERDRLLAEIRKKEREAGSLKDETHRERREKERNGASLRRMEEELKESREALALSLATLKEQERSRKEVQEKEEDNQKMREGLKTAMQEMATLNQLLEESHIEGERLRSLLQERKEEVVRSREESLRAARGEVEELRGRTRAVEQEKREVERKLRAREEELEEAVREKERRQKEVEEVLGEKEAELTTARARLDVLEEQRTELSCLAAEKSQEVTQLRERIREVEGEREEKKREIERLQRKIETLRQEVEDRRESLRRVELVTDMLREKETELERLREKETELERLREKEKLEERKSDSEDVKLQIKSMEKEETDGQRRLREPGEQRETTDQKRGEGSQEGPGKEVWLQEEVVTLRKRLSSLLLEREESQESLRLLRQREEESQESLRLLRQREEESQDSLRLLRQREEESLRLLRQRETELYTLRERVEELGKDRDRVTAALEKTEAAMIGYRDRAHQQEQSRGAGSERAVAQIEIDPVIQERLSVLQRAVAQLEITNRRLQRRNTQLEQRTDRLKTERKHLREMLTQVERGSSHNQLSSSSPRDRAQESRGLVGLETEELEHLRTKVKELEDQVHYLQLTLVLDHRERMEFIQHSSRNNQWLVSLRQDLTDSLVLVSQQPIPSVLESETHRLDRSAREEELRLSQS